MTSLGWALVQCNSLPHGRARLDRRTQREEDVKPSKKTATYSKERVQDQIFPSSSSGRTKPTKNFIMDFQPPEPLESKSLLSRWPNCGTLGSLGNSHSLRCPIGNGCFWLQCLEASKLYYLCLCENVLWNLGDGQTDVFSVFCAVLIYKKNGPWPLISLKTIHKVLEVILG